MLNNLAEFFLSFSHTSIIISLLILGYIWINQKVFFHAICLVLINILFNFTLKLIFQVPLSSSVGPGYAFPSGHMQASMVLYGWLITKVSNVLYKTLLAIILVGIGISLVYLGYHNYFDVLGGVFFGCILIALYNLFIKNNTPKLPIAVLAFATALMLYIASQNAITAHIWMGYYALIGVIFAEYTYARNTNTLNFQSKIIATIFCFLALFIIKKLFVYVSGPVYISQLQWLIIGFCIPFSTYFAQRLKFLS